MKARLLPTLTLSDIYGPGHIYTAKAPERLAVWVARSGRDDFSTGQSLTVAGSLPTICGRGAATQRGLDLLEEAGFRCDFPLRLYDGEWEYKARLHEAAMAGERVIVKHRHSSTDVPPEACWIPPDLLGFLNNKANVSALVPEEAVPRRRLISADEVRALTEGGEAEPVVLKVPSDYGSGGGVAVALCRTADHLRRALQRFAGVEQFVVEEYLAIEQNLCLNYCTHAGGVRFLGSSGQIVDAEGAYLGNWLGPVPPPAHAVAVGQAIMENAVARGYRGVAGFDIAILADGQVKVLDLNFRLNGSTAALLLQESLSAALGVAWVGRLTTWRAVHSFDQLLHAARGAVRAGWLLPLASYDSPQGPERARLRGLLLGGAREEIAAKNRCLAEWGLICAEPVPAAQRVAA